MRKRFLLPCFAFSILILLSYSYVFAEQDILLPVKTDNISLDELLPDDPKLKRGKLQNGLEYFIYKNSKPENRIEFRLVIKAGSVMEDDDQQGAAHFIEHLAFNGTKHFSGQELVKCFKSFGMGIGDDYNASTNFDETIYKLSVPSNDIKILETAFQIMEDWAHDITFDPEEIEQERSVIIEEWRTFENSASNTHMKNILRGSRYAERIPIGTLESLQNISRDQLYRFYKDWYRPDLIAVIAVGDFDETVMEGLMKKYFANIPMPEKPRDIVEYRVPGHKEKHFSIVASSEFTLQPLEIYKKVDSENIKTIGDFRKQILEDLYGGMLYTRFRGITRKSDPPFSHAEPAKQSLTRSISAYKTFANFSLDWDSALKALLQESKKIVYFGFTESELKLQKRRILSSLERSYLNRNLFDSASIASEYVDAVLNQNILPDFEYTFMLKKRIISGILLEDINKFAQVFEYKENCVVTLTVIKKEGVTPPDKKKLADIFDEVSNMKIEPYIDTYKDAPLLNEPPVGSRVTISIDKKGGITEWKLANGVRVVLKPTDFSNTLIVFEGFSPGGTSLASEEDLFSAEKADILIENSGVGDFNANDLEKKLSDTYVFVGPAISRYEEKLRGNGTPVDLETLFQMIYLRFTAPRADKDVFEKYHASWKESLIFQENLPIAKFIETVNYITTQGHHRYKPMSVEKLEEMNLQHLIKFYKERFADASDFTFIFVGAIDIDKMKPLVERYLGGLPSINRKETWKDHGERYPKGVINETVIAGTDIYSRTKIIFSGYFNKDEQPQELSLEILTQLLQNRLHDVLREELGGVYNVSVNSTVSWRPKNAYAINIDFVSDPDREEELVTRIFKEIEVLKESMFSDEIIDGIRMKMLNDYKKDIKQNRFWLRELSDSYRYDKNPGVDDILNYPNTIKSITPQKIQENMRRYFNMNNYIHITLKPEK